MRVRALAIDVDGTMTENDGTLNFEAASGARWMENRGHKIIFVSGRSAQETYSLATYIGTTRVVVGENGGVIQLGPNQFRVIGNKANPLSAYEYLSQKIEGVELMPVTPRLTEIILERTFDIEKGVNHLIESRIPVSLVDSKYSYHLAQRGLTKASGLSIALEYLGIDPEECVAIGDSVTDVSLFSICGYSIALGNADEEVKEKASFATDRKMGSGAVEALDHVAERFLMIGRDNSSP